MGAIKLNNSSYFLFALPPIKTFFSLSFVLLSFILLTNNRSSTINNPVAINASVPRGAIKFFNGFPPDCFLLFFSEKIYELS